jgi:hypothetical protein
MQRDELLDLLLLDADGGLSGDDAVRLSAELARDPALTAERDRLRSAWGDIKALGRGLALRPDFGESRLAALRAPRREGVIIGGHVRAAAAALLLATFLRGGLDPRSPLLMTRTFDLSGPGPVVERCESDELISPRPGETLRVSSVDGVVGTVRSGSLLMTADGAVRVEPGPVDVDVLVGERAVRIDLGEVSIVGANAAVHVEGDSLESRRLRVDSGSVRLGGPFGPVFRAGHTLDLSRPTLLQPSAIAGDGGADVTLQPTRTPLTLPGSDEDHASERSNTTTMQQRDIPPAHVLGLVTSKIDGRPLPHATVTLTRDLLPPAALEALLPSDPEGRLAALRDLETIRASFGAPLKTQTDGSGAYDLSEVPPGVWRVDVLAPWDGSYSDIAGRFVQLPVGSTVELDYALDTVDTVHGKIVDSKGKSITNALVSDALRGVLTDKYGRFTLRHVPTDDARAFIHVDGFEDCAVTLSIDDDGANQFTLTKSTALTGTVYDSSGAPIKGSIEVDFELGGQWHIEHFSADSDGTFELHSIPVDLPVRLIANASWNGAAALFLDANEGRDDGHDFNLPPFRSAMIYPFDVEYGQPISGSHVLGLGTDLLLPGIELSGGVLLGTLPSDHDIHAVVWATGLQCTPFDLAANATGAQVDLSPARERHLHVIAADGSVVPDAIVVWVARPRDDSRLLTVLPVSAEPDGYELPDFGLDGGGLSAQVVVYARGETASAVDDPVRDDLVITLTGSGQ